MQEKYIVSARKYRPASFKTVVGQKSLTTTLKNSISSGRLAQAYLFCGPRGVGKTSCARIFAKTINCMHPTSDGEACGECESCRDFAAGGSYNVIELDAASNNGVDHIRDLTEQVNIPPQVGRYRVFIIDEVHMLSAAAFNAFLKTLEEPPSYAVFILATTEKNKVLPTILSRCQIYDFHRITNNDIAEHLKFVAASEGIAVQEEALDIIARKSDGAMRDALSIFDQIAAASGGNVTYQAALENLNVLDYDYFFRFVDAFRDRDVARALILFNEVSAKGFDSRFFVSGLAEHVRNLLVALTPSTLPLLEVADGIGERYMEQARELPASWYYRAVKILSDCDLNYISATNKRLHVELCLIELCNISGAKDTSTAENVSKDTQTPVKDNVVEEKKTQSAAADRIPPPAASVTPVRTAMRPVSVRQSSGTPRRQATISLHRTSSEGKNVVENASVPSAENPYSEDQIRQAWNEYIAANPEQKIVTASMSVSFPIVVAGDEYGLEVPNPGVLQEFDNVLPALNAFIRSRLGNDRFTLRVKVAPKTDADRSMTPAERLREMVRKNPSLGELLRSVDAEMLGIE